MEEHSEDSERDDGKWMRIVRNKQAWRRRGGEQTKENREVLEGAERDRKQGARQGAGEEESSEPLIWKKLICLNRYLFLLTQSPKNNVLRPGFVFLAVPALQSDHKTISMRPRPFDVRDATTRCRDLKHTQCHHLDTCTFNHEVGVDVFEVVDSVGMRFSMLNAVCMGTT